MSLSCDGLIFDSSALESGEDPFMNKKKKSLGSAKDPLGSHDMVLPGDEHFSGTAILEETFIPNNTLWNIQ